MSIYKRGKTWWLYISHNGEPIRRTTGTKDEATAQRIHDELKAELWSQVEMGKSLADAFALWLTAEERSNEERGIIKKFLTKYPNRSLRDVRGADIDAVLSKYTVPSGNRAGNVVRAALNLAHKAGYCNRVTITRRKGAKSRLRFLDNEEWSILYECLPEHLKPMALFSVSTGLRQANVLMLRWSEVDLRRKVAWVDHSETKSGVALGVPLSSDALAALSSARAIGERKSPFVFQYRGKPMVKMKTAWKAALERAGLGYFDRWVTRGKEHKKWVGDVTWHTLRHTWASWHVQNGTPLAVLKDLGGWASMDMVMRYAHLAPSHTQPWAGNSGPNVHKHAQPQPEAP
jgi:integrase